ncbi:Protein of unknown function [Collimonas sp. OK307]|uniref:DUF3613 domain-containing protein n=1 Tax=Collimonas sp. OK307 TaxID=1801620 RepID=UPI0008E55BA6|nr:DUF3613 domain-containing protein [Collimonas sp. OK307]SFI00077.1 Protein of unknown function [Collimonas sp. OK307]
MKAQGILGLCILFGGSVLLAVAGIPDACAQSNSRLTGKLLQEPVAATTNASVPTAQPTAVAASSAPRTTTAAPTQMRETPVSAEREARIRVGDVTHTLLQAQADGRVAGPRLPMLGATADASWQRYLDSFKHPLPEFYENEVSNSSSRK